MRRWPWSIACSFGLLHGFGFAGALSELGLPEWLPEQAGAMALLLFNVEVEIGQLVVVGILLALLQLLRVSRVPLPSMAAQLPVYVIGGRVRLLVRRPGGGTRAVAYRPSPREVPNEPRAAVTAARSAPGGDPPLPRARRSPPSGPSGGSRFAPPRP